MRSRADRRFDIFMRAVGVLIALLLVFALSLPFWNPGVLDNVAEVRIVGPVECVIPYEPADPR